VSGFAIGCGANTVAAADAGAALDGAPRDASSLDDATMAPGDGGSDEGASPTDGALPISWDGRAPLAHRDAGSVCPRGRAADAGFPCPDPSIPLPGNPCVVDSDCAGGPNGRCLCAPAFVTPDSGTGPETAYNETFCSYDECFVDSDCGPRVPCDCRIVGIYGSPNVCLSASNCAIDSDCSAPGFCSQSVVLDQTPDLGFFCHTTDDTCIDDVDCLLPFAPYRGYCAFDTTRQSWRCFEEPTRL